MSNSKQTYEEYEIAINIVKAKIVKYFTPPYGHYVTWSESEGFKRNIIGNIDEIISLLVFLRHHNKLTK